MATSELDRIFCVEQIVVPPELPEILKAFTKEVIRSKTEDVLAFSAKYFARKAEEHTGAVDPKIAQLKKLFDKYDRDGSGTMEVAELGDYIRGDLGYAIAEEDLSVVLEMLDNDGSGRIEFNEFVNWWNERGASS
eukprot:PLAT4766.1.p2 GENE.PLAT4766.1~~PLAT4766.1.p2  ORF type:complete len:135 (-),score=55.45 PLAT4766.1:88-492(-)